MNCVDWGNELRRLAHQQALEKLTQKAIDDGILQRAEKEAAELAKPLLAANKRWQLVSAALQWCHAGQLATGIGYVQAVHP